MAIFKNTIKLAIIFSPCIYLSCVVVPVEVTLDKAVYITEARVKEIVDEVHTHLSALDLAVPGHVEGAGKVKKADCSSAFNRWLDKQFDNGLIPKRIITPEEYAKGSANPLIHQCKTINLDVEFPEAVKESVGAQSEQLKNAPRFHLDTLREKINSKKCTKNFIDPEKQKFHIKAIKFSVKNNTLNIPSPRYGIYYTSGKVTKEELEQNNALSEFIGKGQLKLFAKSEPIPPRFRGDRLIFSSGNDHYKELEEKLGQPDVDILAVPDVVGRDPETTVIGDKPYYVVPKGHLMFYISVDLAIKAELSDALCALQEYKDDMKAQEEERRKNTPNS